MLVFALAANALVVLLACVGMMVVFLGSSAYLPALLPVLALALPFSFACLLFGYGWFARKSGWRGAFVEIWKHVPAWVLAALALAVALIFCGELALYITLVLAEQKPRLWQHLPLLAGLLAATAFAILQAVNCSRKARPQR